MNNNHRIKESKEKYNNYFKNQKYWKHEKNVWVVFENLDDNNLITNISNISLILLNVQMHGRQSRDWMTRCTAKTNIYILFDSKTYIGSENI